MISLPYLNSVKQPKEQEMSKFLTSLLQRQQTSVEPLVDTDLQCYLPYMEWFHTIADPTFFLYRQRITRCLRDCANIVKAISTLCLGKT